MKNSYRLKIVLGLILLLTAGMSVSKTAQAQTETKLVASDRATGDIFGTSVSLSGNRLLVGASLDDDNGDNAGSAYIFEWQQGEWVEVTKILASDGEENDEFGGISFHLR